jgi:hypothetical protein
MKSLATDADTGIIGDHKDIERRAKFFGKNRKPLPQLPSLLDSIKEALDDKILLSLAIAAFFTLITGIIASGWNGLISGISIYLGIFFIVSISSANDWMKDKQFVKL